MWLVVPLLPKGILVKRDILTAKLLKTYLPGKRHLNRLAGERFQPRLAKYFT